MRLVLILLLAVTPAVATPGDEKACTFAAAERLPRTSGIVVGGSRVRSVPAAMLTTYKGDVAPVIVDIDVSVAGQSDTYSYLCIMSVTGPLIRRLAN